jgi:glycogen phosphorylase
VMRSAIALNGSFFNTQRMVRQYVHNAYFPGGLPADVVRETIAAL